MRTYRSIFKFLVPSWLSRGDGGKVLESLTETLDDNESRERQGLLMRFPSKAQPDALDMIGDDRGILRGRTEDAGHYARRLIEWRYPHGHRTRGSAFAALNQISEYFGGIRCWSIDVKGNRHVHEADGTETFSYAYSWSWDTITAKGRFWFVIEPGVVMQEQPSLGEPSLWGGALGTPGYSIGQLGATPDDAAAIRGLFTGDIPWKPGGTMQQWLCVALDGIAHVPDVTWAHWSKAVAGVRSASRAAGWRFWALYEGLNVYTPVAANACALLPLPDGSNYTADALTATATITLPDGTVYAPNAANARATIELVDDGDQP